MKVRDLIAQLRAIGAVPLRVRGSHHQWRLPNGTVVTIVGNHRNAEASRNVLASLQRAMLGRPGPRG